MGLDGAALANLMSLGTSAMLLTLYVMWWEFSRMGDEASTWPGLMIARAMEKDAVLLYLKVRLV